MKKLILFYLIIQFYAFTWSQDVYNSPVIIYSLSINTIVKVNDKEIRLDSMLVCNDNNQIEIIEGTVRLYYGEDIKLNAGKKISIVNEHKQQGNKGAKNIYKVSRFMNEPSVYLPNLYSAERNYFKVFPLESKVFNASNIKIYVPKGLRHKMSLKLYLKSTDSLIWATENLADKFDLSEIGLIEKSVYYWVLYAGIDCVKGEFELLPKEKIKNIEIKELLSIGDYLDVFFIFLENNCKFDAIATLSDAIKKYPECKIFRNLADKIPIGIE